MASFRLGFRLLYLVPVIIIGISVVVMMALVAAAPQASPHRPVSPLPMITAVIVEPGSLRVPVYTRGVVAPQRQLTLITEVSGRIVSASPEFKNGGFFKKGEVLVRLAPEPFQLELTKKQQAVDAAIVRLEEVKARAVVARQGAKQNATDFALYIPQLNDAKSTLAAAEADYKLAALQLERAEIRAPFDGRFKATRVNVGQYVALGHAVAEIFALDVAEIRLPISDEHLALLDIPNQYQGDSRSADTYPEVRLSAQLGGLEYTWSGRVTRAEGGLANNRLLYLVAEVTQPYQRDSSQPGRPPLEMGRFVEARISGRLQQNVVVVPRSALRPDDTVWVAQQDAGAEQADLRFRKVDVLYKGKDQIYLRGGLQPGDRVVTTRLDFAVDGMNVRLEPSA
ncbi:MAG: efflux RND transporter periplasmic adaptor subunit [Hahellaceae bacterium]|jgi:RND family efflux transporter MFP subunit|nr:efflux RND transporter periplasmic adaptor subunit [Hahellaceae bacterium]